MRYNKFKFNILFNEHFPWLFSLKYSVLSRKNWRGERGLLFKHGTIIDVY